LTLNSNKLVLLRNVPSGQQKYVVIIFNILFFNVNYSVNYRIAVLSREMKNLL